MAKRKAPEPDPDRLRRQQAGTYRSEDDRFDVREADAGWFAGWALVEIGPGDNPPGRRIDLRR